MILQLRVLVRSGDRFNVISSVTPYQYKSNMPRWGLYCEGVALIKSHDHLNKKSCEVN